MNTSLNYATVRTDAGLFREYMAVRFGQTFAFGGSMRRYHQGMKLAAELARLAGLTVEEVVEAAKADAELIYG